MHVQERRHGLHGWQQKNVISVLSQPGTEFFRPNGSENVGTTR